MRQVGFTHILRAALLSATALAATAPAFALDLSVAGNNGTLPLPTGQYVTPTAISGAVQQFLNPGLSAYPKFVAGEAVRAQLSPDGSTLAILTAGQNTLYKTTGAVDAPNSTQYIFLYNVAGANKTKPVLTQVIQQANAYVGLVWSPDGNTLYATGGNDDAVYVYGKTGGTFAQTAKIALGHSATHGNKGIGFSVQPNAGGLGLSADGATLVVANNYNDSISVIDTASNTVRYEHDLRPYFANNEAASGVAGGEYPVSVVVKGNGTAYVGSNRDREVVVVDISSPTAGHLITRIRLDGNANGMTLDAAQAKLYVAQDNADQVAVIDTASNAVVTKIDARAPAGLISGPKYTGAATYAVTISPDGNTLYAVNDGSNSIAVIPLTGAAANTVSGLIPTAYAPKDITFSADGSYMYIINGKSDQGANPQHLYGNTARLTGVTYPGGNAAANTAATASNEYQFQMEHATLVSAPVPAAADLPALTNKVAQNNFYNVAPPAADAAVMAFLRSHIQHVIYIVKENRTYDQVLGDLTNGANGDPTLTVFGRGITPNQHRIASGFVTLDNFMDAADGSMDGWSLATQGRVTTTEQLAQQLNYAGVTRGMSYESEGSNRNAPVGLATTAQRDAATGGLFSTLSAALPGGTANLLPGIANISATDAPFGIQQGYIYNAVLTAGGSVRNYGFLVSNIGSAGTIAAPVSDPFAAGVVQTAPLSPALLTLTDTYYRGYDNNYPDTWRLNEWKREFQQYVAGGNLPSLETVRLSHDHTGNFGTALAGVSTPEAQVADNDLAVGRLVEAVAHSPYAHNTLIIVTEDDSQDGPDHMDSHRTTTYVVGPYVKKHAVISTRYSQVNVLRTIEDVLGAPHINLNTAFQRPMTEVFDITQSPAWTYSALASTVLKTTSIAAADPAGQAVQYAAGPDLTPAHDAAYWDKVTDGFDFSKEDRVPMDLFNQVLWEGLKSGQPYPTERSGKVLNGASQASLTK